MLTKRIQALLGILLITVLLTTASSVAARPAQQQQPTIAYNELTGVARYMGSVTDGHPIQRATASQITQSNEEVARSFLTIYGDKFGVRNAYSELKLMRETRPENGSSTVRFQQTYQGIPVLAGELIVQLDSAKNVLSANGKILPNLNLDVTPSLDAATAAQTALSVTAKQAGTSMDNLKASAPELWIYNPALLAGYKGVSLLTWRVEVTPKDGIAPVRQLVLVEAKRGSVALSFNQVDTAKNRLTYNANGSNSLPGTLVCTESTSNCGGGSGDAYNAHLYAGQTYDFYQTIHGRDSIDGSGMALVSSINYDDVPGGASYENAFWDGTQMVYGAGFASADDVVGHELTHGVTEKESQLFYFWQSGAINESFSDVWGEFIDQTNGSGTDTAGTLWQMGEDLPASIGVIRNMADPTLYGDPDKITSANYYTGAADNGGVHFNSGVNNKAAYLMVDGDTFNGKTVNGLGITKTAKIYYYAQTNLLTSGSDYADLYYALQTSCAALTGTDGITSADCQEVKDAIDAVEMNLQPVAGYNQDVAACDVSGQYPAPRFIDTFEAGASQWSHASTTGTDHWSFDWPYTADYGIFAHSGVHFMYADDYPDNATDTSLRMSNSVVVPTAGYMIFHHAYSLESGFDGGVLEISTNGGSTWSDASSYIDGNGYDGVLSGSLGNPLGGRNAFTGDSHGYISTRLNLASLAGQSVLFRFRLGLDSADYAWGWWVDDVQIYECVRFSDVGTNHWAYSWIDKLAVNNVTGGCGNGKFCPDGKVTRAQMAVFLLRSKYGSSYNPPAVGASTGFADVSTGYWAAAWIKELAAEGITGGCGNGNYCPEGNVTRDQMAVFLLTAKNGAGYTPPAVGDSTGFTDVPIDYWTAAWVKELAAQGITGGCGGSNYCPSTPVSRDQMAVFLVKTFVLP